MGLPSSEELQEVLTAFRQVGVGGDLCRVPVLDQLGVRALDGGRNNSIFGCRLGEREVCVKHHRSDGRQRARREWETLVVLAERRGDLAPEPLAYDAGPPEMTAMTLVPGERMDGACLSAEQIQALALQNLHAVTPASTDRDLSAVSHDEIGLLNRILGFWSSDPLLSTRLHEKLAVHWRAWSTGPDIAALTESAPRVLGQGDGNLANCLWNGQRVRFVDLEYGGWSNRVFEVALIVEHVQSRATPQARWDQLVDSVRLTAAEQQRMIPVRRLVAWFWTMTLWQPGSGADPAFVGQAERVQELLVSEQ